MRELAASIAPSDAVRTLSQAVSRDRSLSQECENRRLPVLPDHRNVAARQRWLREMSSMWEVFNPWTGDTKYTLPAWVPGRIVNLIVTLFSPDLDYAREGEWI